MQACDYINIPRDDGQIQRLLHELHKHRHYFIHHCMLTSMKEHDNRQALII